MVASKHYGLPPDLIRRPGGIYLVRRPDGTRVVATKGGCSRQAANELQSAYRAEFAYVAHLIKTPIAADLDAATANSQGSLYLPRDLLAKAAYGTLLEVHFVDGTIGASHREAAVNGQYALQSISQVKGSILYRSVDGWTYIAPSMQRYRCIVAASQTALDYRSPVPSPSELQAALDTVSTMRGAVLVKGAYGWVGATAADRNYVLVSTGVGSAPYFAGGFVIMSDVQSLLDSISSVPGSILFRSAEMWVALEAGPAGYVLTVDEVTGLPVWGDPSITAGELQQALDALGNGVGSIIVRSANGWTVLAPGTDGYALVTHGVGEVPSWDEISGGGSVGNLQLISAQSLAEDAASISFTDIPQTYRSLRIIGSVRMTGAATRDDFLATFNDDTAANYGRNVAQTSNGSVSGFCDATRNNVPLVYAPAASAAAQYWGDFDAELLAYAATDRFKSLRCTATQDVGTASQISYRIAGIWRSTNAVTAITLRPDSGNVQAGSSVALYGIL